MAGRAHKQRAAVNEWWFRYSFPPHRPLMIGGFSFVLERVAVSHTFGRGKRLINARVSATHLENERIPASHLGNERIPASHLGNERISATSSSDDWRLFIRFRTSGGSAYVWERKTPRKRAGFRHPSRERVNFRHSFEAGVRRQSRPKTRAKKVLLRAHISG